MFPFNLTCPSFSLLDGLYYLACLSLYSARNGHTYLTTTMTSSHSSQLFCLLLLFPFCLMQSILLRLESLEQGECKWRDCYSIWGGWSSLNAQTLTSYAFDCHAVDIMPWVSLWASFSLSILVSTFRVSTVGVYIYIGRSTSQNTYLKGFCRLVNQALPLVIGVHELTFLLGAFDEEFALKDCTFPYLRSCESSFCVTSETLHFLN